MRTLVAGWFSYENMHATAGDLLVRDQVCEWLTEAGCPWDVAVAPPFNGGIDWRTVDPSVYSRLVFVCGPAGECEPIRNLLDRFEHCRWIGINLSMIQHLDEWNPFDVLFERDSSRVSRPDISFLAHATPVPVVGVILVHPQPEYGDRGMHERANELIRGLCANREMAVVNIDTCLDTNRTGLRSPAEIESLIARMDLVVTTRLHGTVLALKHGVPAIAVDPIAGGAKIRRQAEVIEWPVVFDMDSLTEEQLLAAYDFCLTAEARRRARECREHAIKQVTRLRQEVLAELSSPAYPDPRRRVHGGRPQRRSEAYSDHVTVPVVSPTAQLGRMLGRASSAARRLFRR